MEVNKVLMGAALALGVGGCVLVGSTYGCGRMHGKHGSSHGKCNLVHSSQPHIDRQHIVLHLVLTYGS